MNNDLFDKVPPYCTRCQRVPPTIRARHRDSNYKEFICVGCKNADRTLRNVPVKPKITNDKIPVLCSRCHGDTPKIRVHFKDYGFNDYICYDCKETDAFLRDLPVRPKEKGFSQFSNYFSSGFIRV